MKSPQGLPSPLSSQMLKRKLSPKSNILSETTSNHTNIRPWMHTTPTLILEWLLISIPLVLWDLGYVLLRPFSMPGGSLHAPIWSPYEKYVRTDYIYGWKAFDENNGFTAAQASMNVPETLLYLAYMYLVYSQGIAQKAVPGETTSGVLAKRCVAGEPAALAVLLGFTGAIMTFSKTVLYGLNESYSGWSNVGHNSPTDLVLFWIIPNGAWLVASALMSVAFGKDILQSMSLAAGAASVEEEFVVKEE